METDVEQESQPATNFFQQLRGDNSLSRVERPAFSRDVQRSAPLRITAKRFECGRLSFQPMEPEHQVADGHRAQLDQRLAADPDRARLGIEALALATGATHHAHVFLQLHAPRTGRGLFETAQELGNDPFPFAAVLPNSAAAMFPFVSDMPVAGTI